MIPKIKAIAGAVALVMHGSSSVPADLVNTINKYGGKLEKTMGVPVDQIQKAIKLGVSKINVDTDGRLAFTAAIREHMAENPKVFDQRKYLGKGRDAIYTVIKSRMEAFGTTNHSDDYNPLTLNDMKKSYGY